MQGSGEVVAAGAWQQKVFRRANQLLAVGKGMRGSVMLRVSIAGGSECNSLQAQMSKTR